MWNLLKPLIDTAKILRTKGKGLAKLSTQLKREFLLLEHAQEIHNTKAQLFNHLILKLDTAQEQSAIASLRQYMQKNDMLTDADAFHNSLSVLEKECVKGIKEAKTKSQRSAKYLAGEIQKFIDSPEFEDYKRQLFIQKSVIAGDRVTRHVPEFKRALEREGELLGWESAFLTQIEERISSLSEIEDPYKITDANTVVSVIKQVFMLYGLHDFKIFPTGSTARGSAVAGSDYDIVIWLPEEEILRISKNDSFADFFNFNVMQLIKTLPDISKIKLKKSWKWMNYLKVQMIEGSVTILGTKSAISLEITDDLAHFSELIFYAKSHKAWLDSAQRRVKARFLQDVKSFKLYLAGVGLYSNYRNIFKGYYIETILTKTRLHHFFVTLVHKCLPLDARLVNNLTETLLSFGLTHEDVEDLLKTRYPVLGHSKEVRAQLILLAAQRYLRGQRPGLDLQDVSELFPADLCVQVNLISTSGTREFSKLTKLILPVKTMYLVPFGQQVKCYLVLKQRGLTGRVLRNTIKLRASQANSFLEMDLKDVKNAAITSRNKLGKKEFGSKIISFYRRLLLECQKA